MKGSRTWIVALVVFVFLMVGLMAGCKAKSGPPDGMAKDPANAKKFMMDATKGKGLGATKAGDTTEPAAKTDEPAPKADEPVAKPDEPAAKPATEPAAKPAGEKAPE